MEGSTKLLETLLLNFLFLLLPILFFVIFENSVKFVNKPLMAIILALSMILCMSYPIHLESGFIFDLRYIPFIFVSLYGGYKYGFLLLIVLNIYRFVIGGEGFVESLLFSICIWILLSMSKVEFFQSKARNRIAYAVFMAFITMLLYLSILSMMIDINREFWTLAVNALLTHVIMTMIITSLIEKIYANTKAREAVVQSERLQLISELAASVAHEIRNPLTVTNGFLQLLSQSDIAPTQKSYVDYSLLELNRAESIINDFLAFSKPQCEHTENTDLKVETEYAKNILLPYANMHKVDIKLSFHNSLRKELDTNQMQQCLINLYKNGIEAMKDNGGVLSIDVSSQRNSIILKIKDTGTGMNQDEMSLLGKPYYSTKKEGTGLGMLMVYSTINKLNGKIEVESKKGIGTTFTITIPV